MQQAELIFPAGTQESDVQCLAVPLIDNNIPDGKRNFTVRIVSFRPLVRVEPGLETKTVIICDNDGMNLQLATIITVLSCLKLCSQNHR